MIEQVIMHKPRPITLTERELRVLRAMERALADQGDAQSRLCWSSLCLIDSRRVGSGDRRGCVRVDQPRPWRR